MKLDYEACGATQSEYPTSSRRHFRLSLSRVSPNSFFGIVTPAFLFPLSFELSLACKLTFSTKLSLISCFFYEKLTRKVSFPKFV